MLLTVAALILDEKSVIPNRLQRSNIYLLPQDRSIIVKIR